jgi:hypothetical protein
VLLLTLLTIRFLLIGCGFGLIGWIDLGSVASLLFGFDPTSLIDVNLLVCPAQGWASFVVKKTTATAVAVVVLR